MLGLRMAAVVGLLALIVLLTPAWYVFGYLPMRRADRWRAGRGLSRNIQGGIVASAMLFSLVYLVWLQILPSDVWHGFNALFQGSLISLSALGTFVTRKFVDAKAVKYLDYLAGAKLLAGLGLLNSGICWFVGREIPIGSEVAFFAISMLALVATEVVFLKANNWVFIPDHPK